MKTINCKSKKEYNRYEHLFKILGIEVKHGALWVINYFLTEIAEPYMLVFDKNKNVIGIVNLKE